MSDEEFTDSNSEKDNQSIADPDNSSNIDLDEVDDRDNEFTNELTDSDANNDKDYDDDYDDSDDEHYGQDAEGIVSPEAIRQNKYYNQARM